MVFMGKDDCLNMKLNLSLSTDIEILHSLVLCVAEVGLNMHRNSGVSWAVLAESRVFSPRREKYLW